MTFKAVKPFRLRLNGQSQTFAQGQTFELDSDAGERLLAKAPELVSTVFLPAHVGDVVMWRSPLFGRLQGPVLLIEEDSVLVDHPTIGQPAWICRTWIQKGEL
jgi:hypothetical protein